MWFLSVERNRNIFDCFGIFFCLVSKTLYNTGLFCPVQCLVGSNLFFKLHKESQRKAKMINCHVGFFHMTVGEEMNPWSNVI